MTFLKDILLIDFETTDVDPEKAKPLQIAAVLLDKNDLSEKESFSSYIKHDLSDANPKALEVNGITEEMLASAPIQDEVIRKFVEKFGNDVLLASCVQYLDLAMLLKMIKEAGLDLHPYDHYHYLDVWPVAYTHLVKGGYSGGLFVNEIMEAFALPPRGTHQALEDCRIAAEILRKVMCS